MCFWRLSLGVVCLCLLGPVPSWGQQVPFEERVFNEQLLRPAGQPVVPLYEGWYENPDGSLGICFGYFNLNTEQSLDIPLGPDNYIEPAEFDGIQPTHFDPVPAANYRRHWCVFSVEVPADFDEGDRLVWTLRSGGEELSTPGKVIAPYVLDEPESGARGIVAPALRFNEQGPSFRGRSGHWAPGRTARVGEPVELRVWADHPDDRVWVSWTKHQGPGNVAFSQAEGDFDRAAGPVTTTATFRDVGEYIVRVQSIHHISSFEFHCCWTNGYVPVTVTR